MLVISNNVQAEANVIRHLQSHFAIKHLGQAKYFLGIELFRHNGSLILNQRKYASDLLEKANLVDSKGINTPATHLNKLSVTGSPPFEDGTLFRSLVGGLQYLTITRPDISYAVHKVAQFMQSPSESHWEALK